MPTRVVGSKMAMGSCAPSGRAAGSPCGGRPAAVLPDPAAAWTILRTTSTLLPTGAGERGVSAQPAHGGPHGRSCRLPARRARDAARLSARRLQVDGEALAVAE